MKKNFVIILLALICIVSCEAQEKNIPINALPVGCVDFINNHFPRTEIKYAKLDADIQNTYEVTLNNGTKIEFNKKGEWVEIDANMGKVPTEIIPTPINEYVSNNYPKVAVSKIEKELNTTKIKLSDGTELEFNKTYQIIEIDHD